MHTSKKPWAAGIACLACIICAGSCSDNDKGTGPGKDVMPPAAITDLANIDSSISTLTLRWTASGDDSLSGTAAHYDIRCCTAAITESNWDSTVQCSGEPTPRQAGSVDSFIVTGLEPATTYYLAVRIIDEAGNVSGLSNIAEAATEPIDLTPPSPVIDLAVLEYSPMSAVLSWTAPGDDSLVGHAMMYDVRYYRTLITPATWDAATPCSDEPAPQTSGCMESYTVTGLSPDKPYYFAVKTIDDAGNISDLSNVTLAQTKTLFADEVIYPAGNGPELLILKDVDNDGDNDAIMANGISDDIAVLRSNGNGTFQPAVYYSTGTASSAVCAGDFDVDGDLDLAAVGFEADSVRILFNDGDGAFLVGASYAVREVPESIAAADFDGNGTMDLVVGNYQTGTVSILLNNGDGTFGEAIDYGYGFIARSLAVSDVDGDGDTDVAVTYWYSYCVKVLENNGSGVFQISGSYSVGGNGGSVCTADFDGDNDYDLVVTNPLQNQVSVLLNTGNGSFGPAVYYLVENYPVSVSSSDIDNDGDDDLIISNSLSSTIAVMMNDGTGSFARSLDFSLSGHPSSTSMDDLDGDGDVDIAVSDFSDYMIILINRIVE